MKSSGTNCSRKSVTTFEVFTSSLVLSVFRDVSTLKMSFPSVYLFNISSSTLVHDIFFPFTPYTYPSRPPSSSISPNVKSHLFRRDTSVFLSVPPEIPFSEDSSLVFYVSGYSPSYDQSPTHVTRAPLVILHSSPFITLLTRPPRLTNFGKFCTSP